uniref:Uncharacterized protein n=1 Tax=Romanomermis culicivorax TaxID=13658 RepID=A0A915J5W7_ROMCU
MNQSTRKLANQPLTNQLASQPLNQEINQPTAAFKTFKMATKFKICNQLRLCKENQIPRLGKMSSAKIGILARKAAESEITDYLIV